MPTTPGGVRRPILRAGSGIGLVPRTRPFRPSTILEAPLWRLSGITKDAAGVALGACTVHLFRTLDDFEVDVQVSDATTGFYEFFGVMPGYNYYVVAYKVGLPDVSGTTLNTLVGA